jgi:hypothetical protein
MKKLILMVVIMVALSFLVMSCANMGGWKTLDKATINNKVVYVGMSQTAASELLGAPDRVKRDVYYNADVKQIVSFGWYYGKYVLWIQDGVVNHIAMDTK